MGEHHGKFIWYELMTTDTQAAEAFYRSVVGWGARDAGMEDFAYTLLSAGERDVAGLMELPEEARKQGARPGWNGYIAVDDVDAAAAEVARLGGTIHMEPHDIPDVGRFAMAADPQGAVFALFKPLPVEGGEDAPTDTPGHAGWRQLNTSDWLAAFDFYAALFGWTKDQAMDMGEMGVYQLIARKGEAFGAMMNTPEPGAPPHWLYYFNVDAIDAARARVKAAGGEIMTEPHEVPGGAWIVHCRDPQGAAFSLVSMQR